MENNKVNLEIPHENVEAKSDSIKEVFPKTSLKSINIFHYSRLHIRFFGALLFIFVFLFFIWIYSLLLLNYYFLPNGDKYFQKLADEIKSTYGAEIKAQSVVGKLVNLNPRLLIKNFEINRQGEKSVTAELIEAELSWRSLFMGKLIFNRFSVSQPQINLERNINGKVGLVGFETVEDSSTYLQSDKIINLLMQQNSIRIINANVSFQDHYDRREVFNIDINSDIGIEQRWGETLVLATLTPKNKMAQKIELQAKFQKFDFNSFANTEGKINFDISGSNLEELFYFMPQGQKFMGHGDLKIWLNIQGHGLGKLVISPKIENFNWQEFPINIKLTKGEIFGTINKNLLILNTENLQITTEVGAAPTTKQIDIDLSGKSEIQKIALFIPQILLDQANRLLVKLISWYPELKISQQISPQGKLLDNYFYWQNNVSENDKQISHYQFESNLRAVKWSAYQDIPGVEGVNAKLYANDSGGKISINSQNLGINLPKIMKLANLNFNKLSGEINWENLIDGYKISFNNLTVANNDGEAFVEGSFNKIADKQIINLTGSLYNGKGTEVWRYMPKVINNDVVDWLKQSIVKGVTPHTILTLRGDLKNFPFTSPKSIKAREAFQVFVPFKNTTLKFQDKWPEVENADGLLLINGDNLNINITNGKLSGADAGGTVVEIPTLSKPVLKIRGKVKGLLPNFKSFMQNSPLLNVIPFINSIEGTGKSSLDLALDIPFDEVDKFKLKGILSTSTPTFNLLPELPQFTEVENVTEFDEQGVVAISGSGKILDIPFIIEKTDVRGQSLLKAHNAPINNLRQLPVLNLSFMDYLSGSADIIMKMNIDHNGFKIKWDANTQNIVSTLPKPLSKEINKNWHFEGLGEIGQEKWRLGMILNNSESKPVLAYITDWTENKKSLAKSVLLLNDTSLPEININNIFSQNKFSESDIYYELSSSKIDFEKWVDVFSKKSTTSSSSKITQSGKINLSELNIFNQKFTKLTGNFQVDTDSKNNQEVLKLNVKANEIEGDINILFAEKINQVNANLSKLILNTNSENKKVPSENVTRKEFQYFPPVNLEVKDLTLSEIIFDKFLFIGNPVENGYEIKNIELSADDFLVKGNGFTQKNTNRSHLQFTVNSDNLGAFTDKYYRKGLIANTKFDASALIEWIGGINDFAIENIQGEANFKMLDGQFLEIEPGAGRLLSLLSMQNILRRVTLDFSDAVSKGYSFDRIFGDLKLDGKKIKTNNVVIDSSVAKILMQGEVSYLDNKQDLELVVLPNLSGSLSTGLAIFANPLSGVIAWLSQKIFGNPFDQILAQKILVKGSMSEPIVKVEKIDFNNPNNPVNNKNSTGALNSERSEISKLLNLTDPTLDPLFSQELVERVKDFNARRPTNFRAECK